MPRTGTPERFASWGEYRRHVDILVGAGLIDENRWRAQRYGFDQGLVDFGKGAIVPYAELLEEILSLVDQDARHLDCADEVAHTREILARGTSAHRQLAVFARALAAGASRREALAAVIDWLITETARGA